MWNNRVRRYMRMERNRGRRWIKRYPWVQLKDWHGKPVKDSMNWWWIDGWDWAFGKEFMRDLDAAAKEDGIYDQFTVEQVKEKWGRATVYVYPYGEKTQKVISDYGAASEGVCMFCGSPYAQMTHDGWIFPCCESCWNQSYPNRPWDTIEKSSSVGIPDKRYWRRFSKNGREDGESDITYIRDMIIKKWNKRMEKRQRRLKMHESN